MKEKLSNMWHDPVWSKVIGVGSAQCFKFQSECLGRFVGHLYCGSRSVIAQEICKQANATVCYRIHIGNLPEPAMAMELEMG